MIRFSFLLIALCVTFLAGWLARGDAWSRGETITGQELESHIQNHTHRGPPYRMVPIPPNVPPGVLVGEVRGTDGGVWYSVFDGGFCP